jgi:putative membrane protein
VITSFSLATVCAVFNTTSFVLMALGYAAIKRGETRVHRRYMLSAFTSSCLFLAFYVTRIALFGDKHFGGEGALRVFYLGLLASHVLLALAVAPMVITTLTFGLRGRHPRHERLARVTLPVWAYVSVTGVVVYVMLYHLAG